MNNTVTMIELLTLRLEFTCQKGKRLPSFRGRQVVGMPWALCHGFRTPIWAEGDLQYLKIVMAVDNGYWSAAAL
jgi:hypothetical protein